MTVFMLVGFCFPLVAIPIVYAICAIIRRTLKLPKCCPLTIIDIAVPFAVVAIWNAVYESMVPAKSLANISEMFYLEFQNKELKKRTRCIRIFPNKESLLRIATALLIELDEKWLANGKVYLKG